MTGRELAALAALAAATRQRDVLAEALRQYRIILGAEPDSCAVPAAGRSGGAA